MRWLKALPALALFVATLHATARAGTTGGIVGRIVDSATQAPVAGAVVTAAAPSQTATATTDAAGRYRFLTLVPDTYTVTVTKDGYDPLTQPGLSVFADQVQTLNLPINKTIRTIARVTSRAAANLIKPGTTSDVYSIDAATQKAAGSLIGPGGLSNVYGAIASAPGVAIDQGEAGWFQTVHIRGGDIDQVGYELDGIPVNRVYDNAPMTMLSSLGSQEVQVYTGGAIASADAQGISGYVNQVVKTGTYPGYANGSLSVGTPTFYHQASVEVGGSTPDRLFSYYVGIGAANQDLRYVDNNLGSAYPNSFFYPVNAVDPATFSPGDNGFVYTGANGIGPNLFATLQGGFGIASTQQRDDIVNLHIGIPHRNSGLRDDIQALWMTSEVWAQYYSSVNDTGVNVDYNLGTLAWDDSYRYNGPLYAPPVASTVSKYFFPASPTDRAWGSPLCANTCPYSDIRDSNDNGVAVEKLQYRHAFTPSSFLQVYGYLLYSNWFIWGPNTAAQPYYGAELAQYEIPDHTFGGNINYTNQISAQHLLTATYGYTGSNLQRYYVGFIHPNYGIANFIGKDGNCYDPSTGLEVACYAQTQGQIQQLLPGGGGISGSAPPGTPGAKEDAQWLITNNTFAAPINQVHTRFSGWSISDQWRPDDKLNVNLGLRVEDFQYLFGDTQAGSAARQFWFTHYNQEYCTGPPGTGAPTLGTVSYAGGYHIVCPAGETTVGQSAFPLLNINGGSTYTTARFQPRLGVTYTLSPIAVLRASFGVYARPPNSSWVQYNVTQQDLPTYLGSHFYNYGFNTPEHYIRPDTSYNYDLSWEQRLKGTDWSFKLTPFYRSTRDQLQNFFIDPQGGLESGLNVGHQTSYGAEFALQKGDFARDGWSGQLAYTYTHSRIQYQNFSGLNLNVIDQLNFYVKQYNAFTKAGGGAPCYTYGGAASSCSAAGVVTNPYYNSSPQALFDRNGSYTTYDVIPGPASGAFGYETPSVASLIVNYKHQKFAITPSLIYSSGSFYGSPTQWPGYNPAQCLRPAGAWIAAHGKAADPALCGGTGSFNLPLFIPDKFTGAFDNLGAFQQPWRLSLNLAAQYDLSPQITARVVLTNIVDHCGQRGEPWDNPYVCVYGNLPSGILYPAGNYYPNHYSADPPPQLAYPYSYVLNNNNTGFVGTVLPMEVNFTLNVKL